MEDLEEKVRILLKARFQTFVSWYRYGYRAAEDALEEED